MTGWSARSTVLFVVVVNAIIWLAVAVVIALH